MDAALNQITWVLEDEVFADSRSGLKRAAESLGHATISWRDEWWNGSRWPRLEGRPVLFHGSLGNAARIRAEVGWRPGSFCNVPAFCCSTWYPRAAAWLLNSKWKLLSARDFVGNSSSVLDELGCGMEVFVRPDSPLKPFSGRTLSRDKISLEALDFGFYFEDPALQVIVAPVVHVGREWRCIVSGKEVVAVSSYVASTRTAHSGPVGAEVINFARMLAQNLQPPDPVYVLDVCEGPGGLRLLELNPFSGADLYDCSAEAVAKAVAEALRGCRLTNP